MNTEEIVMSKILELLDNPDARMTAVGMIIFKSDQNGIVTTEALLRMNENLGVVLLHVGTSLPVVARFYLSDPNFFDKVVKTSNEWSKK